MPGGRHVQLVQYPELGAGISTDAGEIASALFLGNYAQTRDWFSSG
jgi:hypothetical protein